MTQQRRQPLRGVRHGSKVIEVVAGQGHRAALRHGRPHHPAWGRASGMGGAHCRSDDCPPGADRRCRAGRRGDSRGARPRGPRCIPELVLGTGRATVPPAQEQAMPASAYAPDPAPATDPARAYAMAGAAMAGVAMAGAVADAPAGFGHAEYAYAEPSRYPAAPTAGLGAAWAPVAPADTDTRTLTNPTPTAPEPALPEPRVEAPAGSLTQVASGEAAAPADLASLSPQHVALLSWWADMIATGQVPNPATLPVADELAPPPHQRAPSDAASRSRLRPSVWLRSRRWASRQWWGPRSWPPTSRWQHPSSRCRCRRPLEAWLP